MNTAGTLDTVAWGENHFGSVCTGGFLRKRDIDRAIKAGLVECIGPVALCDGDGFTIHPERYRPGYKLTKKGREEYEQVKAKWAEQEQIP